MNLPEPPKGSELVLEKEVGKGSFGIVYLAHYKNTPGAKVAVKVTKTKDVHPLERHILSCMSRVKLLKNKNAEGCIHKNILCIKDFFETKTAAFIVSEYIVGAITLATFTPAPQLTKKERDLFLLEIIYQLADALEFMHSYNICHRDIKPANILMRGTVPVYIDFDLACLTKSPFMMTGCRDGARVGTPNYMAPEVWRYIADDWKAVDIFALGGTIFYMTNNHLTPYSIYKPKKGELEKYVLSRPPMDSNSGIPQLDILIKQMLAYTPKMRPTASETKKIVHEIIEDLNR